MSRIVGFFSCKGGIGKSSIIKVLSANLSKIGKKTLVIDGYFGCNSIALDYDTISNHKTFDLKNYFAGDSEIKDVINKLNQNLFYIKTNNVMFNYVSRKNQIHEIIKMLANYFDFILIDINCFDDVKTKVFLEICNEAVVVLNDETQVVRNSAKLIQKICFYNNIKVKNLIVNYSRLIFQIKGKVLSKNDIEDVLKQEIIFEIKKSYKHNNYFNKKWWTTSSKFFDKLTYAFCENRFVDGGEKKKYFGAVGRLKRMVESKYE